MQRLDFQTIKIQTSSYTFSEWDPQWEIDLGAEKVIAAEKGMDKIAVEIKSFEVDSFPYEFHKAIGHYIDYFVSIESVEPDRLLFLAVPDSVYTTEFQRTGIKMVIERFNIFILSYEASSKKIIRWVK